MISNKDTFRLLVTPFALSGIQANCFQTIGKYSWMPACQYPIGYEVEEGEAGMMVKRGEDGTIIEHIRRVFVVKR